MPTTRRVGVGSAPSSGNGTSEITVEDSLLPPKNAKPVMQPLQLESAEPPKSESYLDVVDMSNGKETSASTGTAAISTTATTTAATAATKASCVSLEERYETEKYNLKVKHWRESPFAVGLTEVSWQDERSNQKWCDVDDSPRINRKNKNNAKHANRIRDPTGCLCLSGIVCSLVGASRVGNLIVLKQSMEWVEELETDDETGEDVVRRINRPKLDIVVGPYWPMLFCVTFPLIFGVSFWTLFSVMLDSKRQPNAAVVILWVVCTVGLIGALCRTSFSDPGVLYRFSRPPPQNQQHWRWNDQAQTYRPRGAIYDPDTAVVIEEFDHTCPWTGTAIGKKNMLPFQVFVCLVFVCMIFNILILAGALK